MKWNITCYNDFFIRHMSTTKHPATVQLFLLTLVMNQAQLLDSKADPTSFLLGL